jgi:hypothetical protein
VSRAHDLAQTVASGWRFTRGAAPRHWNEALDELERLAADAERLRDALDQIAENAEAWHGPPPENSGHVRSLAVIAKTARAVLKAAE